MNNANMMEGLQKLKLKQDTEIDELILLLVTEESGSHQLEQQGQDP